MDLPISSILAIAKKTHPQMVTDLAKDPAEIKRTLTNDRLSTLLFSLGMIVGATDKLDLLKKVCIYNKEIPGVELIEGGGWSADELTDKQVHLLHMATGVLGEAGELVDAVIKHLAGEPLDVENLIEELGDLAFYQEGLAQAVDCSHGDVLLANKLKLLGGRYLSGKYSDEQAQARADKEPSK